MTTQQWPSKLKVSPDKTLLTVEFEGGAGRAQPGLGTPAQAGAAVELDLAVGLVALGHVQITAAETVGGRQVGGTGADEEDVYTQLFAFHGRRL